jgi:hypothetical protein
MKSGYTRSVFDALKRYLGVVMQQGRTILDSDWKKFVTFLKGRRRRRLSPWRH